MSGEIFWCGSDGYLGFVDFDTDVAPVCQGIEVDSSLDKRLSKFFSSGFQGICSDRQRSLSLIGFKELNEF